MSEDVYSPQPAQLPQEILKQKRAITIYQVVVVCLGIIAILVVLGGIVLSIFSKTMPESVVVLGSIAVGGLVALVGGDKGSNNNA